MQEHEYKARDKTVKKMSREGLTEENLRSRKTVRISRKEIDHLKLPGQAEDAFQFSKTRRYGQDGEPEGRKRRRPYAPDTDKLGSGVEGGEERREINGDLPLRSERDKNALSEPENGAGQKRAACRRYQEKADAAVQKKPDSVEESENPEDGSPQELPRGVSEHSSRMGSIRGHPSGSIAYVEAAAEVSHIRKKKQVQAYARKEKEKQAEVKSREADAQRESRRFTGNKEAAEQSMENFREEIKGKAKREQLHKEQRKKSSRLSFGDENGGMVRGAGMGVTKKAMSAATGSAAMYLHGKGHEAERENAAVEGSHRAELAAENALRYAMHKTNRGI